MRYNSVELQAVCNINMGQSPDSTSYNQENDGMPFFQGNADFGDMYPVTRMWCNKPTKIANAGELLLSVRAPIGALNFATEECCIGRGLAAISPVSEKVNIKYIYYALKSKNQELNNKGTGSTFKAINKGSLSEVKVYDIDISEQNDCVEKLDRVSEIIKYRKTQLNELDNLIKSRFVEMFGDPSSNPMKWQETTIGDSCYYVKDGPHVSPDYVESSEGIPFISGRNIMNGYIDWSTAKYVSENDYNIFIKKCNPQKGDILYSKGGTTGIAKYIDTDIKFANWVHLAVLKFDNNLNGIFFENMLNSSYCYQQSQRLTKGIANRDLVLGSMKQISFYLPPIDLQIQFATFVQQVDKLKVEVQKSLNETQLLFDSLMQKYFE